MVKRNAFCFGSKRKLRKVQNFGTEYNGHSIQAQTSVKYLGVNLDNFLSGEAIANSIIHKVNTRLKFLYRHCSSLNEKKKKKKSRKLLCSALIQGHLDYSCSSWYASLNKTLKKKLKISQNKVVRFIKKLGPRSHIGYSELDSVGFLNADNRVKQLRLNHVFKIFNGTSPSYLLDHFHRVSESHRYNTRGSSENFVVARVFSQASTTFFFNGIKDWNGLPSDIKRDGNFNRFKTSVKRYLNSQMQLMENDIFY